MCENSALYICRGRRQTGIVNNPTYALFTLDIRTGLVSPSDSYRFELSGLRVSHQVEVVGLVLIKRRHHVSTQRRQKRAAWRSRSRTRHRGAVGGNCQRYDWTVNITELGWGGIVSPKVFQPNYCSGGCPIYGGNISNNAIIRRTYNRVTGKRLGQKVPSPCCVPKTVQALEVLYLHNGTLTFKIFDDVIATECACL